MPIQDIPPFRPTFGTMVKALVALLLKKRSKKKPKKHSK